MQHPEPADSQERPDEALVADAGALLAAFPATKAQLPRVIAAYRCVRKRVRTLAAHHHRARRFLLTEAQHLRQHWHAIIILLLNLLHWHKTLLSTVPYRQDDHVKASQ